MEKKEKLSRLASLQKLKKQMNKNNFEIDENFDENAIKVNKKKNKSSKIVIFKLFFSLLIISMKNILMRTRMT